MKGFSTHIPITRSTSISSGFRPPGFLGTSIKPYKLKHMTQEKDWKMENASDHWKQLSKFVSMKETRLVNDN